MEVEPEVDVVETMETPQDESDVAEMIIVRNDDEVSTGQRRELQNVKLENEEAASKDVSDDAFISMLPDGVTPDILENITTSVSSLQQTISRNFQASRIAGPSSTMRQVAIAPKPTSIVKNVSSTMKKISLSNLRPKNPIVQNTSGRQIVVIPSTDGRVKVIGPGSTSTPGKSTQVVRVTPGGQVVQLRQASMPPLAKYTLVPSGESNGANSQKNVPRYLSLQQAQQMGLVSDGKIHQLLAVSPIKQGEAATSTPSVRPVRHSITNIKSPAKILPAPPKGNVNAGKMILTSQNVLIKQPSTPKTSQVLKVDGSGNILASIPAGQKFNSQTIHHINLPGKGMQYVRLVSSNPSQQKISTASPVRIAPMSVTSVARTIQTNSKVIQASKPAQVITKPLMFDMQGNILQVASADVSTSNSGIAVKKIIAKPQTKLLPVTITLNPATQKIVQTSTASGFSVTSMPNLQIDSNKEQELEIIQQENMEFQISKTEVIEEEVVESEEIVEEQVIDEEQHQQQIQRQFTATSPAQIPTVNNSLQTDMKHIVMVPASYIQQIQGQSMSSKSLSIAANVEIKQEIDSKNMDCSLELGMRPRKPCNCTKSQCLKLYCDCFANGEFCNHCNCNNCFNNLENEEYRQKAIRTCLERNPNAFRPKIGKAKNYGLEVIRRHNKGCNCKRSGCLKNYCECYEGKIACSANCKCIGCRNVEDSIDKRSLRKARSEIMHRRLGKPDDMDQSRDIISESSKSDLNMKKDSSSRIKKPWSYMTVDVIEAVCNCLIAQASDAEAVDGPDAPSATTHILEEFGRCLQHMINTAQASPSSNIPDDVRGVSI